MKNRPFSTLSQKFSAIQPHFESHWHKFENDIIELAHIIGVDFTQSEIDHLALRVNQISTAQSWLSVLQECGETLSNANINGRPIYVIELANSMSFLGQEINIIELPFPKNKIYPQESWEHIEIVVPFLYKETSIEWVSRVQQHYSLNQKPELRLKVSEPKVDGVTKALPNPSIAVNFADQSQNSTTIKFHPYSLKAVVLSEQEQQSLKKE